MASKLDLAEKITTIGQGQGYTVGQMLPLDSIRTDGGTQARAGLDDVTVQEYAETWLNLSHRQNGFLEMPPIVVFHDGESYWLADGFHRVEAYKRFVHGPSASASAKAIRAEIRSGTRRDAVLFACGANASHGLKRTAADKRRAIERVLGDEEWRQWSDSEIGRRCQVDHKTVAAVRAELYPGNSQDSRLVERSGTTYQQKPPAARPRKKSCGRSDPMRGSRSSFARSAWAFPAVAAGRFSTGISTPPARASLVYSMSGLKIGTGLVASSSHTTSPCPPAAESPPSCRWRIALATLVADAAAGLAAAGLSAVDNGRNNANPAGIFITTAPIPPAGRRPVSTLERWR